MAMRQTKISVHQEQFCEAVKRYYQPNSESHDKSESHNLATLNLMPYDSNPTQCPIEIVYDMLNLSVGVASIDRNLKEE